MHVSLKWVGHTLSNVGGCCSITLLTEGGQSSAQPVHMQVGAASLAMHPATTKQHLDHPRAGPTY
jgi:hypothetical protein